MVPNQLEYLGSPRRPDLIEKPCTSKILVETSTLSCARGEHPIIVSRPFSMSKILPGMQKLDPKRLAHPAPLQAASVFRAHQSWPDREEGALYVQPTCLDVQKNLCTVSPKGKSCRRFSARATEQASPCRGYSVRPVNLPGRAKNP